MSQADLRDPVSDEEYSVPKQLILVVEDEPAIREMLAIALEAADYRVITAMDAQTGHARIVDDKPDLVLLDWMMPGTTGLELLRRLKRDDLTAKVPVIMLTAKAEEDSKISGLDAGADDFIPKPIDEDFVLQKVRYYASGMNLPAGANLSSVHSPSSENPARGAI